MYEGPNTNVNLVMQDQPLLLISVHLILQCIVYTKKQTSPSMQHLVFLDEEAADVEQSQWKDMFLNCVKVCRKKQNKTQVRQGYTEKPCLEKTNTGTEIVNIPTKT